MFVVCLLLYFVLHINLNEDLIKKLRGKAEGEIKQIIFRIKLEGAENRLCIAVDSSSITVSINNNNI